MLIIDASNLLHAGDRVGDGRDLDLHRLTRLIRSSRYRRRPVRFVCDGVDVGSPRPPGVQVVYAGTGREADDIIEHMLDTDSGARRFLVVSTDRRLRRAARRRRATSITSEAFLRRLLLDEHTRPTPLPAFARNLPLSAPEVAYWLEQFDQAPDDGPVAVPGKPPGRLPSHRPARDAPRPARTPTPPSQPQAGPGIQSPATEPPPSAEPIDPILLDALEHWAGRLDLDDLDMTKWL